MSGKPKSCAQPHVRMPLWHHYNRAGDAQARVTAEAEPAGTAVSNALTVFLFLHGRV
jgi:hypothetical protein